IGGGNRVCAENEPYVDGGSNGVHGSCFFQRVCHVAPLRNTPAEPPPPSQGRRPAQSWCARTLTGGAERVQRSHPLRRPSSGQPGFGPDRSCPLNTPTLAFGSAPLPRRSASIQLGQRGSS